ncbi:MAG: M15 family metallopeptidase [Oscillospiraceae bacterium]|nr:M15 family metallopeptidase [Oscillospiraceae bacterium]
MSNGTRIDPEEREPRAIKIRQPKHTGRKIVFSVLAVLSAVLVIGAGVFAYINFGDYFEFDKFGKTSEESSSPESEPEIPEESFEPEIPEESEPEHIVPEEPAEPEVPEEPVEPEKPEIPKDEWFMLLVNKENPLSEDFSIEAVTIDAKGHTVDARIAEDLSAMISAGEAEGLDFVIQTAFRTYAKQKEFFEAGTTDAAPGTSEHNSGLAIDIGCANGNFEGSPEETWLLEHAHEYGFILRYPADKTDITGFEHEPWHFRYVGKEQAVLIKESGLCLEEYLLQE